MCLRSAFGWAIRVAVATSSVEVFSTPNPYKNAVVVNMHVNKHALKEMKIEMKPPAVATADGGGAEGGGAAAKVAKTATGTTGKGKGSASVAAYTAARATVAAVNFAAEEAARAAKRLEKVEKKKVASEEAAFAAWQSARGGPHKNEWFLCKHTMATFSRGALYYSLFCVQFVHWSSDFSLRVPCALRPSQEGTSSSGATRTTTRTSRRTLSPSCRSSRR